MSIMVVIIQHHCMVRKKHSLVLNSLVLHHGDMTENKNASKARRVNSFMRYMWNDQVAAHRALLRPHDDYLVNRRGSTH
jgi:hypothetical protein